MGMKAVSMTLRALFVVQLVLGILFWTGVAGGGLVALHMLIGIIFVALVWYTGIAAALRGGSMGLILGTFVIGLALALVGLFQTRILPGSNHWIIQVVHLLLALCAVGIAESATATFKRKSASVATTVR